MPTPLRLTAARRWSRVLSTGLAVGLTIASMSVLTAAPAGATTATVTNCSDSGPGSLRAAVASAPSGTTITFATGCPAILLTSGVITIGTSINIFGPGAKKLAVDGGGVSEVFSINSGVTVTISGITIQHAGPTPGQPPLSPPSGGGIFNAGTLTITNSAVTANATTGNGAGIDNQGTLTVANSTLSGNNVTAACESDLGCFAVGGAIFNEGTAAVSDTTISGNTATGATDLVPGVSGAGIFNFDGTLTVTNCRLTGNSTNGTGGAITVFGGTATVTNSRLAGNVAAAGGALENDVDFSGIPGTLAVTHSRVIGNTATGPNDGGFGGGIDSYAYLNLSYSTVSNNSAVGAGGGLYESGGSVTVNKSHFAHNLDSPAPPYGDFLPGIYNNPTTSPVGTFTATYSTFS
jgi:hypothetical protein